MLHYMNIEQNKIVLCYIFTENNSNSDYTFFVRTLHSVEAFRCS